ncbi:hypothetical protein BH09BAC1_BH09BAC1_26250 [soil metagenome]
MTTITVKITDPKYAEMLETMLRSMDFVADVEITEDHYQLTDSEMMLLKERREEYRKNPSNTRSWEEVQSELKQRYGL